MASFLIDAVLAIMLVTATVFLVIVNKRLKVMRASQTEIGALITTFSKTIDETEASVQRLVAAATEASAKLADGLDRAKGVTEDVGLILGSCERASKRIEQSVQEARALVRRLEDAPSPRPRPRPRALAALMDEEPAKPATARAAEDTPAMPAANQPANPPEDADGFRPMLASALARTQAELSFMQSAGDPPAETSPADDGARQAASAFYARLRTVGSER